MRDAEAAYELRKIRGRQLTSTAAPAATTFRPRQPAHHHAPDLREQIVAPLLTGVNNSKAPPSMPTDIDRA